MLATLLAAMPVGAAESLLPLIREDGRGMRVMLGVWIPQDDTPANRREVEAAVRLAADYPEIVAAVSVGNETQVSWSHDRCETGFLVGYVREVRARVAVPVTTADENWKGGSHPDEVEKHWGLHRSDRSPKAAIDPASGG